VTARLHPVTGLHYNLARWCDPDTARYLSPDPIGQAGGLNVYAYAAADPINRIDPLGLKGASTDGRETVSWPICELVRRLTKLSKGTAIDMDAAIGLWLGIAGGIRIESGKIIGSVTVGPGIGLGASAGVTKVYKVADGRDGATFGTTSTVTGGIPIFNVPVGGSVSLSSGTGGVFVEGTLGVGFGMAVVTGFTMSGVIIDCPVAELSPVKERPREDLLCVAP